MRHAIAAFVGTMWLLVLGLAGPALADKRVALVIGNGAYQNTPALANPTNDATDIAEALRPLGYEIIFGLDLDKTGMDAKIREFSDAIVDADVAVFFYAGHGLQFEGTNYLVPVDARALTASALDFEMVRLDLIQRQMESGNDRTNILFFDACRNNPLTRSLAATMGTRGVSVGRGLAQPTVGGAGTLISFSAQPDSVAQDGKGRNSPYSGALVEQMRTSREHIGDMLMNVRNQVRKVTKGGQTPWTNESLTRKFYFTEPATEAVTAPAAPVLPAHVCANGLVWNGSKCAPPALCPAGWNGTYPQCCPAGSSFKDGACRTESTASTTPEPRSLTNPSQSVEKSDQPPAKTIQKAPTKTAKTRTNTCPTGTTLVQGQCRSLQQAGSSTQDTTTIRICLNGSKVILGASCTQGTSGTTTGSSTQPAQRVPPCPPGQTFVNGFCVKQAPAVSGSRSTLTIN